MDIEILVNNDSHDIEEYYHEYIPIIYTYNESQNLGTLYKQLFDKASKEYVYFLEDDDIMCRDFFNNLNNCSSDIIYGKYKPANFDKSFISFFRHFGFVKDLFLEEYDDHNFQFGQIVFRKTALDEFPEDNNLDNDFLIFKRLKGSFEIVSGIFYIQTRDGKDAISSTYNKDPRWIS